MEIPGDVRVCVCVGGGGGRGGREGEDGGGAIPYGRLSPPE